MSSVKSKKKRARRKSGKLLPPAKTKVRRGIDHLFKKKTVGDINFKKTTRKKKFMKTGAQITRDGKLLKNINSWIYDLSLPVTREGYRKDIKVLGNRAGKISYESRNLLLKLGKFLDDLQEKTSPRMV